MNCSTTLNVSSKNDLWNLKLGHTFLIFCYKSNVSWFIIWPTSFNSTFFDEALRIRSTGKNGRLSKPTSLNFSIQTLFSIHFRNSIIEFLCPILHIWIFFMNSFFCFRCVNVQWSLTFKIDCDFVCVSYKFEQAWFKVQKHICTFTWAKGILNSFHFDS